MALAFRISGLRIAILGLGTVLACSGGEDPGSELAATWNATTFLVTPSGEPQTNVLAAGGSLTITVATDNSTAGTLTVPASLNNGTPLTASMAGTATRAGSTVTFTQGADTFVRNLSFQLNGNTLSATNQTAGSATFTVVLTRQ